MHPSAAPPSLPPLTSLACKAWPSELGNFAAAAVEPTGHTRKRMRELAQQWLGSLQQEWTGAWETSVRAAPGSEHNCPWIFVRHGRIYLERHAVFDLRGCGRLPPNQSLTNWSYALRARLLVVLRLLRLALSDRGPSAARQAPWPTEFTLRVCVDDDCHASGSVARMEYGDAPIVVRAGRMYEEGKVEALPSHALFTMVACGPPGVARTLPLVQWLPVGSATGEGSAPTQRDEDIGVWDHVLATSRARFRQQQLDSWRCRQPVAAWRGSAILGHGAISSNWSTAGVLGRSHISASTWRRSGRYALMASKCAEPSAYNVRS